RAFSVHEPVVHGSLREARGRGAAAQKLARSRERSPGTVCFVRARSVTRRPLPGARSEANPNRACRFCSMKWRFRGSFLLGKCIRRHFSLRRLLSAEHASAFHAVRAPFRPPPLPAPAHGSERTPTVAPSLPLSAQNVCVGTASPFAPLPMGTPAC